MPPLYRTTPSIRINWDNAGRVGPDEDVTGDLESYFVRYGLDLSADEDRWLFTTARGLVVLNNDSGKYSSEVTGSIGCGVAAAS